MNDLELTAHHEAGHAAASVMRGGSELRSITIKPTQDWRGHTLSRMKVFDAAFIIYGGPWAEARAQWPLDTLDGEDDDGYTFDDHLVGAWLLNHDGDGRAYEQSLRDEAAALGGFIPDRESREATWSMELERAWPAIQRMAQLLLDGKPVTDAVAREAVEETYEF